MRRSEFIATCTKSNNNSFLRIWDYEIGVVVGEIEGVCDTKIMSSWSLDNDYYISTNNYSSICLINIDDVRTPVRTKCYDFRHVHNKGGWGLEYHRGTGCYITGMDDNQIGVFKPVDDRLEVVWRNTSHSKCVRSVVQTGVCSFASASDDCNVKLFDIGRKECLASSTREGPMSTVVFHTETNSLFCSGQVVMKWDIREREPHRLPEKVRSLTKSRAITISEDGNDLFFCHGAIPCRDHRIVHFDCRNLSNYVSYREAHKERDIQMVTIPGTRFIGTCSLDKTVKIWDTRRLECVQEILENFEVNGICPLLTCEGELQKSEEVSLREDPYNALLIAKEWMEKNRSENGGECLVITMTEELNPSGKKGRVKSVLNTLNLSQFQHWYNLYFFNDGRIMRTELVHDEDDEPTMWEKKDPRIHTSYHPKEYAGNNKIRLKKVMFPDFSSLVHYEFFRHRGPRYLCWNSADCSENRMMKKECFLSNKKEVLYSKLHQNEMIGEIYVLDSDSESNTGNCQKFVAKELENVGFTEVNFLRKRFQDLHCLIRIGTRVAVNVKEAVSGNSGRGLE